MAYVDIEQKSSLKTFILSYKFRLLDTMTKTERFPLIQREM